MIGLSDTRSTRAPARLGSLLVSLLIAAASLGCAFGELRLHDPLQREYSLQEMQKRYTDLVRFGNYEQAARFVTPAERIAFLDTMPSEGELRFLDYEVTPLQLNEEMTESTVEVMYSAYSPWNLTQIELYETQEWTRDKGIGNYWHVRSSFEGLERYVKKRSRPARSSRQNPADGHDEAAVVSGAR